MDEWKKDETEDRKKREGKMKVMKDSEEKNGGVKERKGDGGKREGKGK